ncbi:hypothetical protein [Methylobacterium gregans]|uniref:hypothetical protein n=1 Tax=Methylobacterium gregans TaxID=374424 RepID=UPI00361B691D
MSGTARDVQERADGGEREEPEQVVEVLRLTRKLGEAEQQPLDEAAQTQEGARQEREVAECERAGGRPQRDHEVGEIVGKRAEAGEEPTRHGPAPREAGVLAQRPVGERAEALGEVAAEAEELDFLGALGTSPELAHVVALTPIRRALVGKTIALAVEMELVQEGRDQGEHEQHDEPRQERDDGDRQGQGREAVLDLPEQLAHRVRAPGDLPPGALQSVLHGGILKLGEIEGSGVCHQPERRGIAGHLGQHPVDETRRAPEQVGGERERELDTDQQSDLPQDWAGEPGRGARLRGRIGLPGYNRVDDELGHVEHQRGQRCAGDAQSKASERQGAIRRPGEFEQGGEVSERTDPRRGCAAKPLDGRWMQNPLRASRAFPAVCRDNERAPDRIATRSGALTARDTMAPAV